MPYRNQDLLELFPSIELGSSIAEQDNLLYEARVQTSALNDLLLDRIDLVPGTKGSGKSALYRIFVEFLPAFLLKQSKAVIAHGVDRHGDSVFHVFKEQFEKFTEDDFVDFWCIYSISLVHEQFIKNPLYSDFLVSANQEIDTFRRSCHSAHIPEIEAKLSLRDILLWTLAALKHLRPQVSYELPLEAGKVNLDLFGHEVAPTKSADERLDLPRYMEKLRTDLESILDKSGLKIWLMFDRLDEIFPRRSDLERRALRALLRTIRIFASDKIRMKVFLRDDILMEVVSGGDGFTALTHLTARQADTLRWEQDQILTMVVKRLFASQALTDFLGVDKERMNASHDYREELFYSVFPRKVHKLNLPRISGHIEKIELTSIRRCVNVERASSV